MRLIKKKRGYCEEYDCLYGLFGVWLEGKCSDENCPYCSNRPKRHHRKCRCKIPFDVNNIEVIRPK